MKYDTYGNPVSESEKTEVKKKNEKKDLNIIK